MSKIYGAAERLRGGEGPVTCTPRAATVAAAARGELWEQHILSVEDLLRAGLARECGGTRSHPQHDNPPIETLLSPAGHNEWHMHSRRRVELCR